MGGGLSEVLKTMHTPSSIKYGVSGNYFEKDDS
jgi:hypothetical protein